MSEMVERVRAAIRHAERFGRDPAEAAVRAMREPTEAMQDSGRDAITHAEAAGMRPAHKIKAGEAWRAMIDAALE